VSYQQRYDVRRTLGEGGFGKVLLAYDPETGRKVAIKVLGEQVRGFPEVLQRFAREARIQARIEHPNLVRIYDFDVSGPEPFLVMEYVRGRDLARAVQREGTLGEPALRRLAREVGSALDELHRAGILHRDLKPPNVMISADDGRAVVMDLGLASAEDMTVLTRTGSALGTPQYMAPEMVLEGHAEEASDQWQLAAVLYFASTGRHLVPGNDLAEIAANCGAGRWRPWPEDHGLPAHTTAAILRGASPDPRDRFASCEDLARTMDGEVVTPAPSAAPRRPRAAWAGLGLAVVLLSAVLPWRGGPPPHPDPAPPLVEPRGVFSGDFPRRVEADMARTRSLWVSPKGEVVPEGEAGDGPGWTPLVTESVDPAFWGRAVPRLPALEEFYGWVAGGGRPEDLDQDLQGELRRLDERFRNLGLPRPFHPYLYVERGPGGWMEVARSRAREAEEAYGFYQEAVEAYLAGEPSELPEAELNLASPGVLLGWRIRTVRPDAHRLIEFHLERASRRVLHRWMSRGRELLQEAVWAAARAAREEPESEPELVRALWDWQQLSALLWFSSRITLPIRAQLGGEPHSPTAHALFGLVASRRVYVDSRWEKVLGGQEEARRAWSRALGDPSPDAAPGFLEPMALHYLLATLVLELGDWGAAREALEEHGWLLAHMPPLMAAETAWDLSVTLTDRERRDRASARWKARALRAIEELVAATEPEDVPAEAPRERLVRLARGLADGSLRRAAELPGG
jgi:serine/threonine-protein kinase